MADAAGILQEHSTKTTGDSAMGQMFVQTLIEKARTGKTSQSAESAVKQMLAVGSVENMFRDQEKPE